MLAAIRSAALMGIDAYDVVVEADAAPGLPQWTLVGLPLGAVKESRERVGAAIVNSGFTLPPRRITINLAPADVRKEGTAFDLPIALGILVATGQLAPESVKGRLYAGELGLDGQLRSIRGALSIARHAAGAGLKEIVIPPANLGEAARVSSLRIASPHSLKALVEEMRAGSPAWSDYVRGEPPARSESLDLSDVVGQETAKRALEIAAAGAHNMLKIYTWGPKRSLVRPVAPLSCANWWP